MSSFFYNLGRMVGPGLRQANWVVRSLTGTEAEAVEAEFAVGQDFARGFLQEMEIDRAPDINQLLEAIGSRLTPCVRDRARVFSFCAVRMPEVNAFALPGGFIFLTRSLIEFCNRNADELAFVMGHEMGHVLKRHAIDRMMASTIIRSGISRLPVGGMLRGPVLQVAGSLLNMGYSQDQEFEADALGVRLVQAAGHDAHAIAALLARFRTGAEGTLSSYFSSHPPVEMRIARVEAMLSR